MAFANRIGNLLKKSVTSSQSLYQAIRCMSSSKVFVGGLSYGIDDQSLRDAFSSFGEVIEARVIMDRETGRSRGFGFVTFTSNEDASTAISGMDGKDLHGRMVRVNNATERTGGFRGGPDGYGGGGGYGRGGYGGGNGSGYSGSYNSWGGHSGGGAGGGGYGGSGGYSGGSYGGGAGGYGGTGAGGNYGVAGSDNYISGADGSFGGGYGGSNAGFGGGSSGGSSIPVGSDSNQYSSNFSHNGDFGNGNHNDVLEDSLKEDADEPNDYADKRG